MDEKELQAILGKFTDAAVKAAADAVAGQLKPLTEQIAGIEKNQGILADTIKLLPNPAPGAAGDGKGGEKKGDKKDGTPEPLTVEAVQKLLDERDAKRQASADVLAARQRVIDAKLKKVPAEFLANAPDTADADKLNAWADGVIKRVNEVLPGGVAGDVGGAGKDGGKPAGAGGGNAPPAAKTGPEALAARGAITPGQAKFATGLAAELAAVNGSK